MKKTNWMNLALRTSSYILVAAAATLITMLYCWQKPTKLAQLQGIIEEKFIDDADMVKAEDMAAAAMIEALGDRWSFYIPASEYSSYEERKANSYVGIGITIHRREDGIGYDIRKVEPSGPAAKAGILPGDILTGVEGEPLQDAQDMEALTNRIKGEAGTEVTVTVQREEESLDITVERAEIPVTVAEGRMLPDNLGLVTIRNFNRNCAEETIAAVKKLQGQGAEGIIFDVRNNGGGYVKEMVKILDFLLPEGDLFRSVDYRGNETLETSDADCVELPMAVLVNSESYSAAEFFAAALGEYQWASIVGEPTTGKGHFQYTLPLNDGSAVNLSVGRYMTPKGVDLEEEGGLTPDIPVEVDEETFLKIYGQLLPPEEDPQIQAAAEKLLAEGTEKSK